MSAALLLIDVQKGLDDPTLGERNNPAFEANIARLLAAWREASGTIIHVAHDSVEPHSRLRPGMPGNAFKPEAEPLPNEQVFRKSTNSAFVGTALEQFLETADLRQLVIAGLTTDHCVSATTRSASDLGFEAVVVSDATATHGRRGFDGQDYAAADIHRISLVSLDGEFCSVRSTAEVLSQD